MINKLYFYTDDISVYKKIILHKPDIYRLNCNLSRKTNICIAINKFLVSKISDTIKPIKDFGKVRFATTNLCSEKAASFRERHSPGKLRIVGFKPYIYIMINKLINNFSHMRASMFYKR